MALFQRGRERVGAGRHDDQMYVIRHEAVAEDGDWTQAADALEELEIDETASIAVQDILPWVSALRNVVRNAGGYNPRKSSHEKIVQIAAGVSQNTFRLSPSFPSFQKEDE